MSSKYEMVYEAWKEYVDSRKLSQILPSYIALSWERCRHNQIDPYDPLSDTKGLSNEELIAIQNKRQDLLENANTFLNALYGFVKGSGFMVILTDEQGTIIKLLGDPEIIQNTSHLNFQPGSNWSEEIRGTNAIGTAIIERRPIQVHGTEHYCQSLHHLTCSAAPIFNENNMLIGIIDVTGPHSFSHSHTLGMVAAAAHAIQKLLVNRATTDEMFSVNRKLNTIMESMSEGLISINRHGVISHLNTLSAKMLNTTAKECIGKTMYDIFGQNSILEQMLKSKNELVGKEIVVKTPSGSVTLICSAKIFTDSKGHNGIIATLHEPKRLHQIVSEVTGTKAMFTFKDVVGNSSEIEKVINLAKMVANNHSTVLIQGESGTGKEIFAQAIHSYSNRKDEPFIAINCAAIPRTLVESELFGYEDGSFTGGRKGGRPGKLELANGGTIFLDEIGDMPLEIQGSLLRFLQERRVTRVGGHKPIPLDVRVITATHKDLNEEIEKGNFRLDLFYRLNVVTLTLPSLRDRKEDIIPIAEYFIHRFSKQMGKPEPVISEDANWLLYNYDWPGNIRELENTIEQIMNILEGNVLSSSLLPASINKSSFMDLNGQSSGFLRESESLAIKRAIKLCQGNITKSAEFLGIGRATLYRKLKQLESAPMKVSK